MLVFRDILPFQDKAEQWYVSFIPILLFKDIFIISYASRVIGKGRFLTVGYNLWPGPFTMLHICINASSKLLTTFSSD